MFNKKIVERLCKGFGKAVCEIILRFDVGWLDAASRDLIPNKMVVDIEVLSLIALNGKKLRISPRSRTCPRDPLRTLTD